MAILSCLIFFDKKDKLKSIFKLFLIISISFLQILTASRAGLVCLFIPLIFIYGAKIKRWIFGLFLLILILFLNLYFPIFGIKFQIFLQELIPSDIWLNFTDLGYKDLDITRIGIWKYALDFILERPIFGHGSNSFTSLLMNETGFWKGHAHNLPLELMVNYGLLASFCILAPIIYVVYKSYFKLYFNKNSLNKYGIFERAWVISLTLLIFMQLVDIQYFDGRISIAGWILLAG